MNVYDNMMMSNAEIKLYDKLIDKKDTLLIVERIIKDFFIERTNDIISTPEIHSLCREQNIIDFGLIKDAIDYLIDVGFISLRPPVKIRDMREKWYVITSIGLTEW